MNRSKQFRAPLPKFGGPAAKSTLLLSGLLPAVKAWGPWQASEEENKVSLAAKSLRLHAKDKNMNLVRDIVRADSLYESGDPVKIMEAHGMLLQYHDSQEPEILWRLCRLKYEMSKTAADKAKKQKLIEEAHELVLQALGLDDENFAVHKWMAIIKNALSEFKGTKEMILESFNIRGHMQRAVDINPKDPTSRYLLGQWCYSVADVPWYQKKIAATLFASPPECSFKEAYQEFLRAEEIQPGFYSMNLLMMAKSCLKLGEAEMAKEYLKKLILCPVKSTDDKNAKEEGEKLLQSL